MRESLAYTLQHESSLKRTFVMIPRCFEGTEYHCKNKFVVLVTTEWLATLVAYIQAGETVVMRGLLWYESLIA